MSVDQAVLYRHMLKSGYFPNTHFILALLNKEPNMTQVPDSIPTLKDVRAISEMELMHMCAACLSLDKKFSEEHAAHIYHELLDWLQNGMRMSKENIDTFMGSLPFTHSYLGIPVNEK